MTSRVASRSQWWYAHQKRLGANWLSIDTDDPVVDKASGGGFRSVFGMLVGSKGSKGAQKKNRKGVKKGRRTKFQNREAKMC